MNDLLVTLGILVPIVTAAAEYVGKISEQVFGRKLDGTIALVKSWIVSIAICIALAMVDISAFGNVLPLAPWLQGMVVGAVVALLANGAFQLDQVKSFLSLIKARKP